MFSNLINFGYNSNEILQIKSLALECTLSEISPSIVCDESAAWTPVANKLFHEFVDGKTLVGKVITCRNRLKFVNRIFN